jgi:hypothetical protein
MQLDFNTCYTSATNSKVLRFLRVDGQNCLVIYCNTAALAKKIHADLKTALNESDLPAIDVLLLHGSQHSLEKFHYTRLFCNNSLDGLDLRAMVQKTSALIILNLYFKYCASCCAKIRVLIKKGGFRAPSECPYKPDNYPKITMIPMPQHIQ